MPIAGVSRAYARVGGGSRSRATGDGVVAGRMEEAQGRIAHHTADGGSLAPMHQTGIISQADILGPMPPVLDHPMLASAPQEAMGEATHGGRLVIP